MAVTMGVYKAAKTKAGYLCANCWGRLEYEPIEDGKAIVSCNTDNCPCSGFVSRNHVEHEERESLHEKLVVKRNVASYVPWLQKQKRSSDEILKDLGF